MGHVYLVKRDALPCCFILLVRNEPWCAIIFYLNESFKIFFVSSDNSNEWDEKVLTFLECLEAFQDASIRDIWKS